MTKNPPKRTWPFILINGTLASLMLGGMGLALWASQRGDADAVSFWTKVSLFSFGGFLLYALPKLAHSLFIAGTQGLPLHVPLLGVIFGLLIVVVMGAAFTTGNNLFYLLLAVLSATLIVSMLANRVNLNRLSVELRVPPHIFAEEPANLTATLSNYKRLLPVFSLSLLLEPATVAQEEDETQLLACFAIVPARGRAAQQVVHKFKKRGVYSLERLFLVTRFPFGLVERRQRVPQTGEIVVYPKLLPLGEFAVAPQVQAGQFESMQRGQGGDLHLIRPYQSADRRRAIDWKATAKTAQLMTRELSREEDWQVTLFFDAQTPVEHEDQFERAVSFAASVIDWLIAKGAAVRLVVAPANAATEQTFSSDFGQGRVHGFSLLGQLARVVVPMAQSETVSQTPDWMQRLSHVLQRTALAEEQAANAEFPAWLSELAVAREERAAIVLLTPLEREALPAWLTGSVQVFSFAELGPTPTETDQLETQTL